MKKLFMPMKGPDVNGRLIIQGPRFIIHEGKKYELVTGCRVDQHYEMVYHEVKK